MRYTRMRFDIWLCLLLAYLAGMGTAKLTGLVVPHGQGVHAGKIVPLALHAV